MQDDANQTWQAWHSERDMPDRRRLIRSVRREKDSFRRQA